jgi:hypothetical protein
MKPPFSHVDMSFNFNYPKVNPSTSTNPTDPLFGLINMNAISELTRVCRGRSSWG